MNMSASRIYRIAAFLHAVLLAGLVLGGCSSFGGSAVGPAASQREAALRQVAATGARNFPSIAARLRLGIDTDLAWRQLDSLMSDPTGDIFWMYPATAFYFHSRDLLDDGWRQRFRRAWKIYTPYRGDTENHFLMYYSSILLFCQEWPDLPGSEWFNGKSSRENYAEAYEYLNHWIDETVRHGSTEWDSPRYIYYYITPLLTLHDFADDPMLRRRAGMMLEYTLADFGVEYLNGSYCGAHSREGDGSVIDPRAAESTSYAQFYFEDSLSFILPDLAFAAMSDFRCPKIIRSIARDRSEPYVHTELQRSRAKIRESGDWYTPVYKYDYMTADYCLGSMQGGLQQPIQQHTWDLTFAADKPNNTLFSLHPQYSPDELAMFFPEEPDLMVAEVARVKGSYTDENKWIGGSPFEQVFQYRGTLIALYDLRNGWKFPHTDFFLPKSLDTMERDTTGWIFCRMGDAFAAIYAAYQRYEWIEEPANWRMRSRRRGTGYLVECASRREMTFEEFKDRCRRSTLPTALISRQEGRFLKSGTNIHGDELMIESGSDGQPVMMVNGTPAERDSTWHFHGPYLRSRAGSGVIEIMHGENSRTLDFTRNEILER